MPPGVELLPHSLPMRLVEEIVELVPGANSRCRRMTRSGDWFFQGHFPGRPIVPATVLVELFAQAGGLAVGAPMEGSAAPPIELRVAAIGPWKFPSSATTGELLEATAQVVGHMAGLFKIDGQVTANGRVVAIGTVTLAEPR